MYGKSNCSVCFPNKKDNSIVFRHAVLKPPTKSDRDLLSKGLDSELSFLSFFCSAIVSIRFYLIII